MANDTAMKRLLDKQFITKWKVKFSAVNMVEQGVTLRIQWLPLFYDNRILKAIFCDYGEIMDIRMCKSPYAYIVAMYGMRKVTLRTTELSKQRIPHFVTFDSGQSLLLAMQGRPCFVWSVALLYILGKTVHWLREGRALRRCKVIRRMMLRFILMTTDFARGFGSPGGSTCRTIGSVSWIPRPY